MRGAAVGIDLGGTKVMGLRIDPDGAIQAREIRDTPPRDPDTILDAVLDVAETLAGGGMAGAVGVGAAGMVDFEAGALAFSPNLPLREVSLRALVADRVAIPCVVDNDANAAAWGEYRFGAARGTRHALVVTVGTGIGGGIIEDGRLFRGAHGFAAEIGHVIVEPDGPPCGCGNRGCWEQVASGQAIGRLGQQLADADPTSLIATLAGGERVTGRHVSDAAAKGDGGAMAIFAEVGRRLGEGIAGLVNTLDPELVVVGGGVAEEGDLLLEPARRAFRDAVEAPDHRPDVQIVAALLGNDAGAIGAAALALDLLE
ncbi:MAG: ROK family glucokinase [Actinomycetota bacterium]